MTVERSRIGVEEVVLVNERDEALGTMEKLEAHRQGVLHRAFSIFLFDESGQLLLQQRAAGKYHSALLWTNTCCSHPRPDEPVASAANRRLQEEMGLSVELDHRFTFIYKARVAEYLWEHELDHVLFGTLKGTPTPDPTEVEDWKLIPLDELESDLERHPERYTAWLKHCWPKVMHALRQERA